MSRAVSFLVAGLALFAGMAAGFPDAGSSAGSVTALQDGGTLDRELIRRVVRSHLSELRLCYQAELKRDAGSVPSGTLKAKWIVDDGEVTSVAALSTVPGTTESFTSCVTGSIRDWRFPKTRGGRDAGLVVIDYPFIFRPTEP